MNETITTISVNGALYDVEDPRISSSDISAWNGKQGALVFNTTYNASSNKVATMADIPSSTPANGGNAATVNNHTVNSDVPANAVFTDNNTTYQFEQDGNTLKMGVDNGTKSVIYSPVLEVEGEIPVYESLSASEGGTSVSLVTTGEKYTWNNKQDALLFNTAYNASTNKVATVSDIPTNVSDLNNDSGFTTNAGTVTGVTVGSTAYTPTNGVVTIPAYPTVTSYYAPTTTGTAGQVWTSNGSGGEWSNMSQTYSDVSYTVYAPSSSKSGAISLDYQDGPIQLITLSGDASSLSVSNIPSGHSCHIMFINNSDFYTRNVNIAHNVESTPYTICPRGTSVQLYVPKQNEGYAEVDFININNNIYVRGV